MGEKLSKAIATEVGTKGAWTLKMDKQGREDAEIGEIWRNGPLRHETAWEKNTRYPGKETKEEEGKEKKFLREGDPTTVKKLLKQKPILGLAASWRTLNDGCYFQTSFLTNIRPDIILWFYEGKMIALVELAAPWEERMRGGLSEKEREETRCGGDIHSKGWSARVLPM